MIKNKQGEFSFVSLLVLLFGSALIVTAVALNSTKTSHFNESLSLNKTEVVEDE